MRATIEGQNNTAVTEFGKKIVQWVNRFHFFKLISIILNEDERFF